MVRTRNTSALPTGEVWAGPTVIRGGRHTQGGTGRVQPSPESCGVSSHLYVVHVMVKALPFAALLTSLYVAVPVLGLAFGSVNSQNPVEAASRS